MGKSNLLTVYLGCKQTCIILTTNLYYALAQVVFLPGFGCLYIDVKYEKGTLFLTLAPEGSMDTVINQHSRYVYAGSCFMLPAHLSNKEIICACS